MTVWRLVLSVVLALLWVPLAAHCEIERLFEVELCHHADADHGSDVGDTSCDDCSLCQSAKVSLHFSVRIGDLKPAFLAILSPWPPQSVHRPALIESPPRSFLPPASDFVLPHACLLTSRTSLPVRAPSLAS